MRITGTLDVIVRPWFRRLPGGDWSKEMYQLQVRYQPSTRIPLRVDAGIISSPLGIIALEMRPDRNPIIGTPSYYFSPLPSFDGRFDRVQLLSGGYPLGAMVSTSGLRWDARAGVTDGTPARNRKMMSSNRPPAEPQFVAGGGVTPVAGLRLGAGYAHGLYRDADGLGVCRSPRRSRPPRRSSTSRASTRSATRASPASGSWTASKRRRTPPSRAAT